MRGKTEGSTGVQSVSAETAHWNKGKALVVFQVNCRSVCNKATEFWNLVDKYNPDVVISMESWFKKILALLRSSELTLVFRTDRSACGGGIFTCVKNFIACTELWVDDDVEMNAIEAKGMDPKYS
jgi:hypothetical protein